MTRHARTLAERDPNWAQTLRVALAAAERFREFMGDERAAKAMLHEGAAFGDELDMTGTMKGRVDVPQVPTRELIRWGV